MQSQKRQQPCADPPFRDGKGTKKTYDLAFFFAVSPVECSMAAPWEIEFIAYTTLLNLVRFVAPILFALTKLYARIADTNPEDTSKGETGALVTADDSGDSAPRDFGVGVGVSLIPDFGLGSFESAAQGWD